jgi:hypothetical protein
MSVSVDAQGQSRQEKNVILATDDCTAPPLEEQPELPSSVTSLPPAPDGGWQAWAVGKFLPRLGSDDFSDTRKTVETLNTTHDN